MLRDRYEPMNLFAMVPALSYTIDRVLAQLDTLLDDDTLFQAVKADLAQRFPRTLIRRSPVHAGRGHSAYAGDQTPLWLELPADRAVGQ